MRTVALSQPKYVTVTRRVEVARVGRSRGDARHKAVQPQLKLFLRHFHLRSRHGAACGLPRKCLVGLLSVRWASSRAIRTQVRGRAARCRHWTGWGGGVMLTTLNGGPTASGDLRTACKLRAASAIRCGSWLLKVGAGTCASHSQGSCPAFKGKSQTRVVHLCTSWLIPSSSPATSPLSTPHKMGPPPWTWMKRRP